MSKDEIARLKDEYVAYFTDAPVQKYAAMFIGRDEETIILWRQQDPDFANRVKQAHAKWARKRILQSKAEFQLERLDKDVFSPRTELTGKDGGPIDAKVTFTISQK